MNGFARRRCLRARVLLAGGVLCCLSAGAATGLWESFPAEGSRGADGSRWIQPAHYHGVRLNVTAMARELELAPAETDAARGIQALELELPQPDGSFTRFGVVESPVMEPELAAKYPQLRTYAGVGLDDPQARVRLDLTPAGFHAQILSPHGAVYIDPLWRADTAEYASYFKRDLAPSGLDWTCMVEEVDEEARHAFPEAAAALISGETLRTYRLAVAATGEYTAFHGGTVAGGLGAVVTAINRVNGVYETELAIRLVLVANNDLVIYTNPATDPYTNNDPFSLLNQNQTTLNNVLGVGSYDLGHVFSTAGGGLASLGVVCNDSFKARGETGTSAPTGDAFYIDYVAHEIGHQFGARHTFNGTTLNCSGSNRYAPSAFEPGSGSTIMAYAGICGADNLQAHSDPYFHFASQAQIASFLLSGGAACPVQTATGNHPPGVDAGPDYVIPMGTPFTVEATATDPDDDPVTFCWEENDLGAAQSLSAADNGASPLFRSFNPALSGSRTFPRWTAILNDTPSVGERLPSLARTLKLKVTARDNRSGGGGVATDDMQLTVVGTAGPFVITSPTTAVTWAGAQTITWNPAATDVAPVNASTVTLRLSTDGGDSFPHILAANTPNDGAESVLLPSLSTSSARVMVEADSNVFFDVSNVDFTIRPLSTEARLAALNFSTGVLDPAFDPETTSYTLEVPAGTSTITATATPQDSHATMTLRLNADPWQALTSGNPSPPLDLCACPNHLELLVTAEDTFTTGQYEVDVQFADPPPPTAARLLAFHAVRTSAERVNLRWWTGVEVDLLGFYLERLRDGIWIRVNAEIVPGRRDLQPGTYELTDFRKETEGATLYRLVSVDLRGTPAVEAEAQLQDALRLAARWTASGLVVQIEGPPGQALIVETAEDLRPGAWELSMQARLDPSSGVLQLPIAWSAATPRRFYRVTGTW